MIRLITQVMTEARLTGTINKVTGTLRHQHRARIRVEGRGQALLIDSGPSINLISTHDGDITKLKGTLQCGMGPRNVL